MIYDERRLDYMHVICMLYALFLFALFLVLHELSFSLLDPLDKATVAPWRQASFLNSERGSGNESNKGTGNRNWELGTITGNNPRHPLSELRYTLLT